MNDFPEWLRIPMLVLSVFYLAMGVYACCDVLGYRAPQQELLHVKGQ